jgi:DNA-binding NarL/FixJ family response regulator
VARESFSDVRRIVETSDLEGARRQIASVGDPDGSHGADPFRLILIDLDPPDGNGLELLAELARDPRHRPALKIVTTLYSDDDHLFPALQGGADGYLLKEDRFEVLVEELQKIVRGQPPLSPAIARRLLTHFREENTAGGEPADPAARAPETPMPDAPMPEAPKPLTARETEVLTFLSKGFTTKEIAALAGIKWHAVNDHVKSIYKKLDASAPSASPALP